MTIKIKLLFILLVFPILSLILVPIRNKAYAVECYFQENIGSGFCSTFDKSWCVKYTYNDPLTPGGCTQTNESTFTGCGAPNDSRCVTSPTSPPAPTSPPVCSPGGDPNCPGNACVGNTCTDCNGVIRGGTKSCTSAGLNPIGYFDVATGGTVCRVQGWTCDADKFSQALSVHLYKDNPSVSTNFVTGFGANVTREAAIGAACGGNTAHGFDFTLPPDSLMRDNVSHTYYTYAINIDGAGGIVGSGNSALGTNAKTMTCNPLPVCTVSGPTTVNEGESVSYTVTASSGTNLENVSIHRTSTSNQSWTEICNSAGTGQPTTCTGSTTISGQNYVVCNAYTTAASGGGKCTGNPWCADGICGRGWADCGGGSRITVNTVAVPPPPVAPSPTPTDSPVPTLTPIPPSDTPIPGSCPRGDLGNINCSSDGRIDVFDLSEMLLYWTGVSTTPTPTPPAEHRSADITGDGAVDGSDVTILINNWGTGT